MIWIAGLIVVVIVFVCFAEAARKGFDPYEKGPW